MKVFSSIKKMISIKSTNKEAGRISICVLITALIFIASPAWSADYYIAQSAAGNNNATSCANAKAISYLTGSWAGKVAAGDTVHLCGTIGTDGATALTVGASGTSGSPITIKFENNAKISATRFNSAGAGIFLSSKNYITIDGGTNGIIENTDNGNFKTYQVTNSGVYAQACSNLEVKNLTIKNLYVRTYDTNDALTDGAGIVVYGGSNTKVHHNTITEIMNGISYINIASSATYTSAEFYNNTISRTTWAFAISVSGNSSTITDDMRIHDNEVIIASNYWGNPNMKHLNGVMLQGGQTDASLNNLQIYNNYFHGEAEPDTTNGWTSTGYIFATQINGTGWKIYNNLMVDHKRAGDTYGAPSPAAMTIGYTAATNGPTAPEIYNNTIIGESGVSSRGIYVSKTGGTPTIKNNIIKNQGIAVHLEGTASGVSIDNNTYYNNDRVAVWTGAYYNTLASFQTALGGCPGTGHDCNSITANPNLNASYAPKDTSPVLGKGVNLTSLGITALKYDKSGIARHSSGTWDIGAYVPTSTTKPKAPRNLRITR